MLEKIAFTRPFCQSLEWGSSAMAFIGLFRRPAAYDAAAALYAALVAQSRRPEFYARCGVPDTVDGRFEMIAVHAFLLLSRLKSAADAPAGLAQALFDAMFEDMDRSLREMGAGDLGVGRRVKAMAKSFYGRIASYERGVAAPAGELEAALTRNLYGTVEADPEDAAVLAAYIRRESAALSGQPIADLGAGRVSFGPPPR